MNNMTDIPSKQEIEELIKPYDFNKDSSKSIDVRQCSYPENGKYLFTCRWFSFIIDEKYISLIIDECCHNIRKHENIQHNESDRRIRIEFKLIERINIVHVRIFGTKYESIIPIIPMMIIPKNIVRCNMIHNFDKFTVFVDELLVEIYNCLEE